MRPVPTHFQLKQNRFVGICHVLATPHSKKLYIGLVVKFNSIQLINSVRSSDYLFFKALAKLLGWPQRAT